MNDSQLTLFQKKEKKKEDHTIKAKENSKKDIKKRGGKGFASLSDALNKYQISGTGKFKVEKNKYVSKEFQSYGLKLASQLSDFKHRGLYIKMAKEMDRAILERALAYVADADFADNKAKLFMWKVQQIKEERKKDEE
jgi:hypothetical protein